MLLAKIGITDGAGGHAVWPELLQNRRGEIAVDSRRRAERFVVGNPQRASRREPYQQARPGCPNGVIERVDTIVARAENPTQTLPQAHLVFDEAAPLASIRGRRCNVELVVRRAVIGAVSQCVPASERRGVAHVQIVSVAHEAQRQPCAVGCEREKVDGAAVEKVRAKPDAPVAVMPVGLQIGKARAVVDIERTGTEPGMTPVGRS